jgi:predicted nucleotidyltransferase component of viral defense system
MTKYFTDGLQKKQLNILRLLGSQMSARGFYLVGGTALAIHFAHRISVDLDWFTSQPFSDGMMLAQSLRNSNVNLEIEQVSPGTLHGVVQGVRVTFLQYEYPLLQPVEHWGEINCPLASLEDLACMKLSAVAQRGARKDFCDIYALGKKIFSLRDMLDLYQKKFNIKDVGTVLYGLVYFDDAENERMPRMLWDVTWKEIKKSILEWVKEVS